MSDRIPRAATILPVGTWDVATARDTVSPVHNSSASAPCSTNIPRPVAASSPAARACCTSRVSGGL